VLRRIDAQLLSSGNHGQGAYTLAKDKSIGLGGAEFALGRRQAIMSIRREGVPASLVHYRK